MSLAERRQEPRHDHRSGFAPTPPTGRATRVPNIDDLMEQLGLSPTQQLPDYTTIERRAALRKLDDLFFSAFLLDIFAHDKATKQAQPKPKQETEPQTPFFRFWRKHQELDYGTAKRAFLGGDTPVGAMTFIGKQWDGLRAVPSEPVTELGGKRPAYHGEYRVVDEDDSTRWVKVTDKHDLPIAFGIPEAAITAAERERAEETQF